MSVLILMVVATLLLAALLAWSNRPAPSRAAVYVRRSARSRRR